MENETKNSDVINYSTLIVPQNNETEKSKNNNNFSKKILLGLFIIILIIISILIFSFYKFTKSNQSQQITTEENIKTDLSSIQIVIDEDVVVSLKDSSGSEIGEQSIEEPIANDATGELSGDLLNIFRTDVLATGNYTLNLSPKSDSQFEVDIYFYDRNAEVKTENKELTGKNTFTVYFDKEDSKNSYIQ